MPLNKETKPNQTKQFEATSVCSNSCEKYNIYPILREKDVIYILWSDPSEGHTLQWYFHNQGCKWLLTSLFHQYNKDLRRNC